MFEQSFGSRTRTRYTVVLSFLLQSTLIALGAVLPLIYTNTLHGHQLASVFSWSPAPPPAVVQPAKQRHAARPRFEESRLLQPVKIPRSVAVVQDDKAPPAVAIAEVIGGIGQGVPGGIPGGVLGPLLMPSHPGPPPPAPPAVEPSKPVGPKPIKVSRGVQEAKQIYAPLPVYPPLARQARISGVVKLNAIIGKDGGVERLTVISGPALLVGAALEAVSKWRYRPTLLNEDPVEVITQIEVHFTLTQ